MTSRDDERPANRRFFGERGEVVSHAERDLVQCHLCGRWLKWISNQHIFARWGTKVRFLLLPHGHSRAMLGARA